MALRGNLIKFELSSEIKINLGDAPALYHYLRQSHLVKKYICSAPACAQLIYSKLMQAFYWLLVYH